MIVPPDFFLGFSAYVDFRLESELLDIEDEPEEEFFELEKNDEIDFWAL